MKKTFLFLVLAMAFCCQEVNAVTHKSFTIKVGEYATFETTGAKYSIENINYISDASIVEFDFNWVKGRKPGTVTIMCSKDKKSIPTDYSVNALLPDYIYVITVIGVKTISIPENICLSVSESYTYSPIITDAGADANLTWSSSNTSVATISETGVVTAVGQGFTTITCTSDNGVKAQSVVTVNPNLSQKLTLDKKSMDMNVGEKTQLTLTITPNDATNKDVIWMSSNENIAQVDDDGSVTAIAPGYCSIYAISDDSSRKLAKCLVHVTGQALARGDVNNDGVVDIADAVKIVNIIVGKE